MLQVLFVKRMLCMYTYGALLMLNKFVFKNWAGIAGVARRCVFSGCSVPLFSYGFIYRVYVIQ